MNCTYIHVYTVLGKINEILEDVTISASECSDYFKLHILSRCHRL